MKKLTKCVNCGSGLVYSPAKNAIACEHCDSFYAMPATKRNVKLLRRYTIDYVPEADTSLQNVFMCNTCNTTHVVAEGKISTRCPSCGDTNISKAESRTTFPDGIIPFKLDKVKAVELFEKWLKKRKFAPNDLLALAKNGKISKVYVPVYNINGTSVCAYNGMVKKVHTDDSSGTIFSTVHTVQDVSTSTIENVALCANSVVDSDLIEQIVDIDPNKIVPYSSEYLFGYYGANTNISIHDLLDKLTKDEEKRREEKVRSKLKDKYDEIVHLTCNTQLRNVSFNYVYVPVFMNHYTYKNKKYHCYINGTNGKIAGVSPKSAGKILALMGGIAVGIGLLILAALKFL